MTNESENKSTLITYPRRVVTRKIFKTVGRVLASILARPKITGLENLPEKGPLILVGNHIAVVEVGMMAIYTPYPVEIMGAGDIPLDPRYAWIAKIYGMIPIKRGSMDREGLTKALEVLDQGGVVGLFPEGGIWETSLKQARNGVAWLSNKSGAPIVPIGFGGIEGAFTAMQRLKRPKVTMNVGKVIPPIEVKVPGLSRKEALAQGANMIMERVTELIPEEERRIRTIDYIGENFDFQIEVYTAGNIQVPVPEEVDIKEKQALSKLFHRPVMLDVFSRNLKIPIRPLLRVDKIHKPADVAQATQNILDYLETNPYFFHYRFGTDEGAAMVRGLEQLRDVSRWVADQPGYTIKLKPIRRYTLIDTNEEVVEDVPAHVHEI